jgi:uncharacterized protein
MTPFFFGEAETQLLGVHHPALTAPARDLGVALCYPCGHELTGAQRTFRVLGTRLARAGFHTLRFDYYGTGDSAGESREGRTERWLDDVESAVDELRRRGRLLRVSLVGLRLGATLATLAAARRTDVECLVLWEPIVNGAAWLAEARARHQAWLKAETRARKAARRLATEQELLGAPLTPELVGSLERIRLDGSSPVGDPLGGLDRRPARRVLVVGRPDDPQLDSFVRHLEKLGSDVDHLLTDGPAIWETEVGLERALVPMDILRPILDWVSRVRV